MKKKVKVRYTIAMAEQNYREVFAEAMTQIHDDYRQSGKESEFMLWFNVTYLKDTLSEITVSVASEFMWRQMVSKGNIQKIESKIYELIGQKITLSYVINNEPKPEESADDSTHTPFKNQKIIAVEKPAEKKKHPQLREDYTFDNFVPGENSMYAFNASLAAAKNPGKAYNPILIYGGVGLGKTHLMQAVGNYMYAEHGSTQKICYVSAESFGNEFIESIRTKTTEKFKNKYRKLDVLLLDDIHFLQGKDATQEELFYTFNALYDKNCQLVFTCDRPVTELKNIEERLSTRFSRGLNIDLQPPNYETRRAILEKKMEIQGKHISHEVIDYIAKNVQTNVRDLESCLTKMIGYAELVGKNVTIEIAQQQLRDTFAQPLSGSIAVETIQRVVANHYNISLSDIKSNRRSTKFVIPRQIAIYIARNLTEYSYPELGIEFGGRDHSTMMHSYEKIENATKTDSSLNTTIQQLIRDIKDYKK